MQDSRWERHSLPINGCEHPWLLWVPDDKPQGHAWPLVVFLHGKGERGDDGVAPALVGLGPALRVFPRRFPCLVLAPQCPADRRWADDLPLIDAVLDAALQRWSVDPLRMYLTGISMGGFGTWIYGGRRASRFAALLPVCGGGNLADVQQLVQLPIWAFHGARDPVIDVDRSRTMVSAVRAAGGQVRYTEYPEAGHDCWDRVYADPTVIEWLLAQRRSD